MGKVGPQVWPNPELVAERVPESSVETVYGAVASSYPYKASQFS